MNKFISILLIFVFLCALPIPAHASTSALSVSSSLTFNGTTANCSALIINSNKEISATMELWCDTILLAVWFGSGTNYVNLSETASVMAGKTYTLQVYGTVNGIPFQTPPITRTC